MRAFHISALVFTTLTFAACEGRPPWLGGSRAFSLYGRAHLRPGIRMTKLQKAARVESRYPFQCQPLWGHAQQCVMKVSPGDLRVIVDSSGRVIRLTIVAPDSFFVWEDTPSGEPIYRYHANQLKRTWDGIQTHERLIVELTRQVEYRWIADQRWAAQMWYSPWARYRTRDEFLRQAYRDSLARVPDSIAVTDAPAYDKLMEQHPVLELLDIK
jgi:hypothetical protein